MKNDNIKKIFLCAIFCFLGALYINAQTGLYAYQGGYFIRDGNRWQEYRPNDKEGAWAEYTQYGDDANYYFIQSSADKVCVPKEKHNSFYIWRSNQWQVVYSTIDIYNYFVDNSRQIYCYNGGYFVRDENKWREYRPNDKKGVWADYEQYGEEDNFFNIKSTACNVSVPRSKSNNFFIYRNNHWEVVYHTTAIYDNTTQYDFTLYFDYYKISGTDDKLKEVKEPASLSVDRKGNGVIRYGSNSNKFTFRSLTTTVFRGTDTELGLAIIHDDDNEINIVLGKWAMVNIKKFCPFLDLMDCKNPETYKKMRSLTESKSYFK